MRGRRKEELNRGFTIVEVMIVLAISGLILLIAIFMIGSEQDNTEFSQAANLMLTQTQQIVNNVSNGYYPDHQNFSCIAGTNTPPTITGFNQRSEGSNTGCVLFGEALLFPVGAVSPASIAVYSIVGNQQYVNPVTDSQQTAQQIDQADPVILAKSILQPLDPVGPTYEPLEYLLTVGSMTCTDPTQSVCGSGGNNITAVAFVSNPSDASSVNTGGLASGSQNVEVIAFSNNLAGDPVDEMSLDLQKGTPGNNAYYATNPSGGVKICFVSGTSNNSALLTIGGNGRQDQLNMTIYNTKTCT